MFSLLLKRRRIIVGWLEIWKCKPAFPISFLRFLLPSFLPSFLPSRNPLNSLLSYCPQMHLAQVHLHRGARSLAWSRHRHASRSVALVSLTDCMTWVFHTSFCFSPPLHAVTSAACCSCAPVLDVWHPACLSSSLLSAACMCFSLSSFCLFKMWWAFDCCHRCSEL